ncbi:MAG: Ig-like domain-containing protein, partial [Candidatus Onthovivens sp.]|nr:Ig-like domain-containing protein [Candidatus Onthovivens sp.]
MRKINYIAVGIILTLATISSCSSKTDEITNINIIYNDEIVDTLNKTKDEIFTLSLDVFSTNKDYKVDWTSSDTNVAIIDNSGKVLTKNVGTTIISATSQKNKKIKSSIFLNVKEVTYQSGAGTGFTKDDPIYIGNEGKEEPLQIYFIEMRQMYADSIYIKKGNVDILIDSGEAVDGELVSQILNEKCTDK